MNVISTLPDPSGLYVLSPEGSLGVYRGSSPAAMTFSPDAELSAGLSEKIAGFLASYLANTRGSSARVAIIYNSVETKPWGHATFWMEEPVVRDVYPVTGEVVGATNSALTAFQKRNREKSIYRGMETLLAHKASSHLAIYCPVLFDRNTTLDSYLPLLGREEQEGDRKTPVLEVLNLVANIPVLARNSPAILELREKLHAVLMKSHMRKDSGLALVENTAPAAPVTPAAEPTPTLRINPDRAMASPATVSITRPPAVAMLVKDFSGLHASDRHEHIERWLGKAPLPIEPMALQVFTPFRALNELQLARIAQQCPVYQAPAGTRMLERGMNDKWNLFLIHGALLLEPQDGATLTLESGTDRTAHPVSSLKPRKYQVVAKTPVKFLWVPDALLHTLNVASTA